MKNILKPIIEIIPENNRLERIWILAKTDFLQRYYGSWLGIIWAFLNPIFRCLLFFTVFTVVFKSRTANFAMFIFLGIIAYMFFSEVSNKSMRILKSKRYLLENIPVNPLDIYYAAIVSGLMAFLFNFLAYFIISSFTPISISYQFYLVPILVLNLAVFSFGTMLILSTLYVHIRDLAHIWDIVVLALFWLSGIFYEIDPSATWKTAVLAYSNPLAGIIMNLRAILIYGETVHLTLFFYDLGYAFVVLGLGMLIMNKYLKTAVEKL